MNPETRPELEQLFKSIQTFENLQMSADSREKMYRYNDALMQSIYSIIEDQEADEQTKLQYLDKTLSQYAEAMKSLFPKIIRNQDPAPVIKNNDEHLDVIEEVEKFNPYHDSRGRFSTSNGYASFTTQTRDPSKQHMADAAIAREKARDAQGLVPGPPKKKPKAPAKPKENPETGISAPEATNTKSNLSVSVLNTCRDVEKQTVNRKTEKMTMVDGDGNIMLERSGNKGSVRFGDYEAAQMGPSVTLTHNHPGEFGGTFSGADVQVFTHYDLRAVRAVAKEGTYSLERTHNTSYTKSATFNRDYSQQATQVNSRLKSEFKRMQAKVNGGEMSYIEANKHLASHRAEQCNKLHNWLTQNAESYGYNYVFTPSGGIGKMFEIEKEDVDETEGEYMLDGEFMNGDDWMLKEESDE